MSRQRFGSVVALAALVACAPAADKGPDSAALAAEQAAVRQAIEETNARAAAALNAGDVAGWSAAYADDAVIMMPNMPAWRGRAERDTQAAGMLANMALSNVKFTTEEVTVSGDLAVETGTYSMTVTPKGGKPMEDRGKYLTVWKKQADGTWKIVRDISNSDLPAAGSPS